MTKRKKTISQSHKNKVPYVFKNEKRNGQPILTLSGVIRERYFDGDECISANMIRKVLDSVDSDDVLIKLNSPGGDVFQGMEIANYLKDHPSDITVEVTGQASSAATFILASADHAVMDLGSTVMVHEASIFAWGNKKDLQKRLNALEKVDESIVSVYKDKTGQSEDQIIEWMDNETYFTAQEAVEYGFADEVKGIRNEEPEKETEEEKELECPECGHTDKESAFESDEEGKYECPECGYVGNKEEFEKDEETEEDLEALIDARIAAFAARGKGPKPKIKNRSLLQKLRKEGI